jgi:hypothetical protein
VDKIDLSLIDANALVAGNLFKGAGDLWITGTAGGSNVHVDVNGDGVQDMTIHVQGVWGLTASDFIL